MKKYNSACSSLSPGQLDRLVAGIKDCSVVRVYPYEKNINGVMIGTEVVDEQGRVLECSSCGRSLLLNRGKTTVSCPEGHEEREVSFQAGEED